MFILEQVCCCWFENDVSFSYIVIACGLRDYIVVPSFVVNLGVISLDGGTAFRFSGLWRVQVGLAPVGFVSR